MFCFDFDRILSTIYIPDAIHHRYANIFYGPQQVFVSNEIPRERKLLFLLSFSPPDGTTVGSSDVLGKMVKEDSINSESKRKSVN